MSSFAPDKDNAKKFLASGGAFTGLLHDNIKALTQKMSEAKKKATAAMKPVNPNDPAVIEAKTKALRNAIRNSTRSRTMLADYMGGQSATAERKPALGS